jgi:hypothetical protein
MPLVSDLSFMNIPDTTQNCRVIPTIFGEMPWGKKWRDLSGMAVKFRCGDNLAGNFQWKYGVLPTP